MARYWIGHTGVWNSTSNWSTSSGGVGGAPVPDSTQDVYFDADSNSGTNAFTVTLSSTAAVCRDFIVSGIDGAMTLDGSSNLTVHGNFELPATNFTCTASGNLTFNNGTSAKTVNFNGNTMSFAQIDFGGSSGGSTTLESALTTSGTVILSVGTVSNLDMAGYTITCTQFLIYNGTGSTTFGAGGSLVLTGTGDVFQANPGNSIVDPENANITLTNTTTTARGFYGEDGSYGTLTIGGATGTSALTIGGSNTFSSIASTKTVAHTITFGDGTAQTVGAWAVKGTAGNVVTLNCDGTDGWELAYTGTYMPAGLDYLSISRCTATPADTWYAGEFSTNGGNNSGWQFMQDPDDFLTFFAFPDGGNS